jgi:hypothetical protein
MAEALITVRKYIKYQTGTQASDMEITNTLKSYFIMNEIGNQIIFQRKKASTRVESKPQTQKGPLWTMNLLGGTLKSNLSKAGLFPPCILEGIETTSDFVKKTTGQKASSKEIAISLTSSFILSEIRNQIDWQRKNPEKANQANPNR